MLRLTIVSTTVAVVALVVAALTLVVTMHSS